MYKIDQKLRPITLLDSDRLEWEEELMYEIEVQGEMDRSDAQGFQMIRQDCTDLCYDDGMTPKEAAIYLLNNEE